MDIEKAFASIELSDFRQKIASAIEYMRDNGPLILVRAKLKKPHAVAIHPVTAEKMLRIIRAVEKLDDKNLAQVANALGVNPKDFHLLDTSGEIEKEVLGIIKPPSG